MTASTSRRVCQAVLFALVSLTGSAMAVITTESGVSANNVPIIDPQGVAPLLVDDGTAETAIGDSGQFIWLNRFTPAPGDFPFQLEEVSAIFAGTMVNVGDSIEIVVYEDTDGDGDPGTGSVLVASFNETIQFNDQVTFNVFTLPAPVLLTGPGDVSIGIINRYGSEGFNDFPAALDQTATAGRSWAATYLVGDVPANPPLPGDEQWGTIDSFGFPGNWVIRGSGSGLFTVGGNLTGLATGATVVLQNNGADNLPLNANGPFTFAIPQADASGYNVTVLTPPPTQLCTVSNGSGTVMAGNVTNVGLNCINAAATAVPVNGPVALAILFAALAFLALYRLKRQSD